MKTQKRSKVYPYSYFNLSARCGWLVIAPPRPLYAGERDQIPTAQEAEWSSGLYGRMGKISPSPASELLTV